MPVANDNAFRCTKLACTLSRAACAERYRQTLELFDVGRRGELNTHRLLSCRGCATGEANAETAA